MINNDCGQYIDIYTHILTPNYINKLKKLAKHSFYQDMNNITPALSDLDARFRITDKYEGLKQVLVIGTPPLESVVDKNNSIELAKLANDEMAELVTKYPDRFAGGVATLSVVDMEVALKETERAIEELHLKGILIYTPANGKPLDDPQFMPLYQKMCEYDLPIWIHPNRERNTPDYPGEDRSKYAIFQSIGWPYETSAAMCRLVFSGVMEKYPNIKFITHHCGAMLPFLANRVGFVRRDWLKKMAIEYFQMFYGDTALNGNKASISCGYSFFGAERILFGTDIPYVPSGVLKWTIEAIESMDIPDTDKRKILFGNAQRILKL